MSEKTYTIDVPKHLQVAVGAAKSVVIPVHTIGSCLKKGGLVLVYEPRRDCEYWLKQSDVYKPPSKTW